MPSGKVVPSPIFVALVVATIASAAHLASTKAEGLFSSGGLIGFDPSLNTRLSLFVFVALAWVVSLTFHEFGHAFTAWKGGDYTVASKGYLNLDPRKYTDPGLSLLLPMVFLLMGGIGLPGGAVWIQTNLIASKWMRSLMSLAGPLTNLAFAFVALVPIRLGIVDSDRYGLMVGLAFVGFLQISAFVLNMIPMPGLDGFGALEPHLSRELSLQFRQVGRNGFLILIAVLWFWKAANRAFFDFVFWIFELSGVDSSLAIDGLRAFQFWN